MTVRFSDIIGKGHKKGKGIPSARENTQAEKELSRDSQALNKNDIFGASEVFSGEQFNEKVKVSYKALLDKSIDIRSQIKTNQALKHSPTLSILSDLIGDNFIDRTYDYAVSLSDESGLPSHAVCVSLASMKVGRGLGYDAESLLRLGLAAFLENVGMYKIPDHILEKQGSLTPEEMDVVKKHPQASAQILGEMGEASQWLAEMALQVHEKSDGSGYPKGLKGEEIDEAASIIGIIDTYIAMINDRPYRDKIVPTEAVKLIIKLGKQEFPPKVVKEFLNQISLFPVNTYVRLNNKSIGRVISIDTTRLLRPTIELLYDGLGQKLEEGTIISLSESPLLHVVDTLG